MNLPGAPAGETVSDEHPLVSRNSGIILMNREVRMIKLLMVTPEKMLFNEFALALAQYDDVDLSWAGSGQKALEIASVTPLDLVVVDEKIGDMTGIEFIEAIVSRNPMISCAAVSPLPSDEFHEVSEGLGILEQLPAPPGAKDAENLLKRFNHLKNLLQPIT